MTPRVQSFLEGEGTEESKGEEVDLDFVSDLVYSKNKRLREEEGRRKRVEGEAHEEKEGLRKRRGGEEEVEEQEEEVKERLQVVEDLSGVVSLAEILEGAEIIRRETKKTDENMTEIQKIRLRSEEKRYQKMLSSLPSSAEKLKFSEDLKEASKASSLVFYFFLTFFGSILLGYYFCEIVISQNLNAKIFSAGVCCAGTLMLEGVLFVVREEKAKKKMKK